MPISEYEYFIENYSFNHLELLMDQFEDEQREATELMEIAVMYGYASAKSKNGKLIKIFEKPKESKEMNLVEIEEVKKDKSYLQNTFSNTL